MLDCRVYWGSHGCGLERGHSGPHKAGCCDVDPYAGRLTRFYGEDTTLLERGWWHVSSWGNYLLAGWALRFTKSVRTVRGEKP